MDTERLVLLVRPKQGEPYLFVAATPLEIGRAPDNGLVLDAPGVSARHGRLTSSSGRVRYADLGSANGTWRQSQRVDQCVVEPHEALHLGGCTVAVVCAMSPVTKVIEARSAVRRQSHVVALPAAVRADPMDGLVYGQPGAADAVLVWQDGALALHLAPRQGQEAPPPVRQVDDDGLLSLATYHLRASNAREPATLPTDLTFASTGAVQRLVDAPRDANVSVPPEFSESVVDLAKLRQSGLPLMETEFLALGGGLGSFVWVDALRVHGIRPDRIAVVGFEAVPYARYRRLCGHSQIPDHERLRSNSESCPDNLWGFPGYGLRESFAAAKRLDLKTAMDVLLQVSMEPDFAPTYTPRAGDVFASVDAEADRIGWAQMFSKGRVRAIRKTTDGRYAVAVSSREDPHAPKAVYVAPICHMALGYPGLQFLDDLRSYRETTRDFARVVNAYEEHDHVYASLTQRGGVVVLRGRGIVASRILQRIYEARSEGTSIEVIHLMRSPKTKGARYRVAARQVADHWEFQPFNWPEACWGGDLRERLLGASPQQQQKLLSAWGGTTTADRPDWMNIVRQGLEQGWYRTVFGTIDSLDASRDHLHITVAHDQERLPMQADYIIDATGLVSGLDANPVYADLIATYGLARNPQRRFSPTPAFELAGLRNGAGRVYVAGVCALGAGYAPVDSFLGLQYAASRTILDLAPRVPPLDMMGSAAGWLRWMIGRAP